MLTAILMAQVIATGTPWKQPQDAWTCSNQPQVAWCGGRNAPSITPSIAILKKAERRARLTFTIGDMHDGTVDNPWMSFADRVDQPWTNDCTGLASTVLDMLAAEGFPKDKLFRALVRTKFRGKPDHMIGIAEVNGRYYVVGDSLRSGVYEYGESRTWYSYYSISPVSGTDWYESN